MHASSLICICLVWRIYMTPCTFLVCASVSVWTCPCEAILKSSQSPKGVLASCVFNNILSDGLCYCWVHMYVCMHTWCTYLCIYIGIHICMYVYTMYICVCNCGYSSIPAHRNHTFDPATVFLSTHWWSQHPACQRCFYKPLKNYYPSQRVFTPPVETLPLWEKILWFIKKITEKIVKICHGENLTAGRSGAASRTLQQSKDYTMNYICIVWCQPDDCIQETKLQVPHATRSDI